MLLLLQFVTTLVRLHQLLEGAGVNLDHVRLLVGHGRFAAVSLPLHNYLLLVFYEAYSLVFYQVFCHGRLHTLHPCRRVSIFGSRPEN